MTPLYIEIALHYYCSTAEFPRLDAPACKLVVADFLNAGLLQRCDGDRAYEPTDGLEMWIKALCAVPFPKQGWLMPGAHP